MVKIVLETGDNVTKEQLTEFLILLETKYAGLFCSTHVSDPEKKFPFLAFEAIERDKASSEDLQDDLYEEDDLKS